jgi:hypothetical protein
MRHILNKADILTMDDLRIVYSDVRSPVDPARLRRSGPRAAGALSVDRKVNRVLGFLWHTSDPAAPATEVASCGQSPFS